MQEEFCTGHDRGGGHCQIGLGFIRCSQTIVRPFSCKAFGINRSSPNGSAIARLHKTFSSNVSQPLAWPHASRRFKFRIFT